MKHLCAVTKLSVVHQQFQSDNGDYRIQFCWTFSCHRKKLSLAVSWPHSNGDISRNSAYFSCILNPTATMMKSVTCTIWTLHCFSSRWHCFSCKYGGALPSTKFLQTVRETLRLEWSCMNVEKCYQHFFCRCHQEQSESSEKIDVNKNVDRIYFYTSTVCLM